MDFILEFFESQPMLKGILFLACSVVFVWLIALRASRTKFIVRDDAELQVHCGVAITLCLYNVLAVILLILLARHYKGLEISLWYTLPYVFASLCSFFLTLNLSNKVAAKLLKVRNKGGR